MGIKMKKTCFFNNLFIFMIYSEKVVASIVTLAGSNTNLEKEKKTCLLMSYLPQP